jgi:hypothetical protein
MDVPDFALRRDRIAADGAEERAVVVLVVRAHPPANGAGRVGQPSSQLMIRKDGPAPKNELSRPRSSSQ